MDNRKLACITAVGFIAVGLSTTAIAKPPAVVVEGKRFNPITQRLVSYADLNLAYQADQRTLNHRISSTADGLCYDLGYYVGDLVCTHDAIHSTDAQVAAAIARAQARMAGLTVGPAIAITMVGGAR
jgi:UrcA family protein